MENHGARHGGTLLCPTHRQLELCEFRISQGHNAGTKTQKPHMGDLELHGGFRTMVSRKGGDMFLILGLQCCFPTTDSGPIGFLIYDVELIQLHQVLCQSDEIVLCFIKSHMQSITSPTFPFVPLRRKNVAS